MGAAIQGHRKSSAAEVKRPGDFYHDRTNGGFWIQIPGDVSATFWPYRHPNSNGACWKFDGNEDAPTLQPSLHLLIGGKTVWHGHFVNGQLRSV